MSRKPVKPPSYVDIATQYARDIVENRIPACHWVQLACKRHFDDLEAGIYTFDAEKAERVCQFVSLLPHVKGTWPTRTIVLEPWQCFFLCSIFGWINDRGYRRYTRASLYVPRKNGKSFLGAAIGLYMLCADGEPGAEVFCGATSEDQSLKVFSPARLMVLRTPNLKDAFGVEVNVKNINVWETGSKFEPLIGDPGDGDSPHCAIIDEYHEHRTASQYNSMRSGMGSRKQPLLLVITTAGSDPGSPCYGEWMGCQDVLEGRVEAPEHFALLYTVDKDDDWDSRSAAIKANPNFGVSVETDFIDKELSSARNKTADQARYKTKHLNIWVQAKDAFFNIEKWRDSSLPGLELNDFEGQRIFLGMDLASKIDIAALVVVLAPAPATGGKWIVFGDYFLPDETVNEPSNEKYRNWRDQGFLTVTSGAIIDFAVIRERIFDLARRFEVVSLPYDPFQATQLSTELMAEGLPVVELRPTVLNFSDPMKMIDGFIRDGQMANDGNPVMTWMVGNVVSRTDKKDNVYPDKNRPEDKIDGPVALIMAMARALTGEAAAPEPSAAWL